MSYDSLKREVFKEVKEKTYLPKEVKNMLSSIGYHFSQDAVRRRLSDVKFTPGDVGVNTKEHAIDVSVILYRASDVWQYFQSLEEKGEIDLHGIGSLEELAQVEFSYRGVRSRDDAGGQEYQKRIYEGEWDDILYYPQGDTK